MEAIGKTSRLRNTLWVLFIRAEYFFLMFPNEDARRALNVWWVRLQDFTDQQASRLLEKLARISDRDISEDGKRVFLTNAPRNPLKFILTYNNLCEMIDKEERLSSNIILGIQPWEGVFQQDFNSLNEVERDIVHVIASLVASKHRRMFSVNEVFGEVKKGQFKGMTFETLSDALHSIQETRHLLLQPLPRMYSLYHDDFAKYVLQRCGDRFVTRDALPRFRDFMKTFTYQSRTTMGALDAAVRNSLYASGASPEAATESLGMIRRLMRKFADQLRTAEVLVMSEEEEHAQLLARDRIFLRSMLEDALSVYSHDAKRRGVGIVPRFGRGDISITGDEAMLSTVFANLIDNAIKYSHQNTDVRVDVNEDEMSAKISVANIGVGIDVEDRVKVFNKCYRSGRVSDRSPAGLGMGLFVSQRIVRAMGGEISVTSTDLPGHTHRAKVVFTVTLPKAM